MNQKSKSQKDEVSKERDIPSPLSEVTASAHDFHRGISKTLDLFMFILNVVLQQDFVAHVARTALDGQKLSEEITPGKLAEKKPGEATKKLRKHRQPFLQIFLCRLIDHFMAYLAEVTREVLHSQPKVLRTGEQVRLDCVLSYESIEDFTRDQIERKVNELSYLGFDQLLDWFDKHLGLTLINDDNFKNIIIEALETRNIIVHNRGIVGEKYIRNVKNSKLKLGDIRELDVDDFFSVVENIVSFVNASDDTIARKFKLNRKAFEEGKS